MTRLLLLTACMGSLVAQGGLLDRFRARQHEDRQGMLDQVKWQHTLWTSPEYPVGVYTADIIKAGFFVSFITADVVLYNQLVKRAVNNTMHMISHDLDGLIGVLEKVKASEARFEERMAFAVYQGETTISATKKKQLICNPLRRYLDTHHRLAVLFDRNTIMALGARWCWDRASCWMEQRMLVQPPSLIERLVGSSKDEEFLQTYEQAYVQGEVAATTPYSSSTTVKGATFFLSPFLALRANLRSGNTSFGIQKLGLYNSFLKTGLPVWLFSQGVQTLVELIELAGAVSIFDRSTRYHWIRYVVAHRAELLRLLYAYRAVQENPIAEEAHVQLIKQELYQFVEAGYARQSLLPGASLRSWWGAQNQSNYAMNEWLRYATLALLALKSAYWLGSSIEPLL